MFLTIPTALGYVGEYSTVILALALLYVLYRVFVLDKQINKKQVTTKLPKSTISVNPAGFVKPTIEHLKYIRDSQKVINQIQIPPEVARYLAPTDYQQMAVYAQDSFFDGASDLFSAQSDARRCLTISAIIHHTLLPYKLFLLDVRTVQLYETYASSMVRHTVTVDDLLVFSSDEKYRGRTHEVEARASRLSEKLNDSKFTAEILKILAKDVPPPLSVVMEKLKFHDPDGLKAMITVFCMRAQLTIPESYILSDYLTHTLYRKLVYGEKILRVV